MDNRPTWDTYYLSMSFLVSQRSFDPSSKCGCIIVSNDNRVLSTGYNGPLKGSDDSQIPLERPDKYYHMIHAEENALLAYNGSYQDIQGATAYVTSRPCHKCLRMLLQKGITRIVHGSNPTKLVDENDMKAQEIMLKSREIDIIKCKNDECKNLLNKTIKYIELKEEN